MPSLVDFWWLLTTACIVWFSTITIYVAVRGALDIRGMFERLRRRNDDRSKS